MSAYDLNSTIYNKMITNLFPEILGSTIRKRPPFDYEQMGYKHSMHLDPFISWDDDYSYYDYEPRDISWFREKRESYFLKDKGLENLSGFTNSISAMSEELIDTKNILDKIACFLIELDLNVVETQHKNIQKKVLPKNKSNEENKQYKEIPGSVGFLWLIAETQDTKNTVVVGLTHGDISQEEVILSEGENITFLSKMLPVITLCDIQVWNKRTTP